MSSRAQLQPLEHARLVAGLVGGVGADRAGDRADRGLLEGALQALGVAVGLERVAGELEAERGRLRVHAVRAADAQRVGELARPLGEDERQLARAGHDRRARPPDLQRERGVEHVGGRQPVVDPAPAGAGGGGQHVDERGHVVVGDRLALLDRLDGEGRAADRLEVGGRRPVLERLGGRDLDVAPRGHPRLVGPDGAELRPCVAGDHARNARGVACDAGRVHGLPEHDAGDGRGEHVQQDAALTRAIPRVSSRGCAPRAPRRSSRCRRPRTPPARRAASGRSRAARRARRRPTSTT